MVEEGDNFSVITESNVEPLAQNKVDEHKATKSAQMAKAHHSALSEVIDIYYKLYTFMCEYYYIIVPWLHFVHFVGMN